MAAGNTVSPFLRGTSILAAVLALTAAGSSTGKAVVYAPTGPPELLVLGHVPIELMDR